MKENIRPYHITSGIIIIAGVCVIIFTNHWLLPVIGFMYAADIINDGIKGEKNKCNCNNTECCSKKDSEDIENKEE